MASRINAPPIANKAQRPNPGSVAAATTVPAPGFAFDPLDAASKLVLGSEAISLRAVVGSVGAGDTGFGSSLVAGAGIGFTSAGAVATNGAKSDLATVCGA